MHNNVGARQLSRCNPAPERPGFHIPRCWRCFAPAVLLISGLAGAATACESAKSLLPEMPQKIEAKDTANIVVARKALSSAIDTLTIYGPRYNKAGSRILDEEKKLGNSLLCMTAAEMVAFYRESEPALQRLDSLLERKFETPTTVFGSGVIAAWSQHVPPGDARLGSFFLMLRNVPGLLKSKLTGQKPIDPVFVEKAGFLLYLRATGDDFKQAVLQWGWGEAPFSNDNLLALFISLASAKD